MDVELGEVSRDDKQVRRNAYWSGVAASYRRHWQEPTREASLFKELEASLFIEAISAARGSKILDICSGTGRSTVALARTGASVCGVDGDAGNHVLRVPGFAYLNSYVYVIATCLK